MAQQTEHALIVLMILCLDFADQWSVSQLPCLSLKTITRAAASLHADQVRAHFTPWPIEQLIDTCELHF
jgi:hypothetical protein